MNVKPFNIASDYNFQKEWCLINLKQTSMSFVKDGSINNCFELTDGDNAVHLLKVGDHYSNYLHPIQKDEKILSNIGKAMKKNKRWMIQETAADNIKFNDVVEYNDKNYTVKLLRYDSDDEFHLRPAISGVRPKSNGKVSIKLFCRSDCEVRARYGMSTEEVCIYDIYLTYA